MGIQSPPVPPAEEVRHGSWPEGGTPVRRTRVGLGQGARSSVCVCVCVCVRPKEVRALPPWLSQQHSRGLSHSQVTTSQSLACTCVIRSESGASEGALQLSTLEK